jgi:hypothetical protein
VISKNSIPFPESCDDYARERLLSVFEPLVVGVPPEDASRGLVRLPDGQLRHYGQRLENGSWRNVYMASDDCGLSWRERPVPEDAASASARSPWSGDWLHLCGAHKCYLGRPLASRMPERGTYVFRSSRGIDGPHSSARISDEVYEILRPPMPLRSRERWVQPTQYASGGVTIPVVLLSDDDGRTWRRSEIPSVPRHTIEWPHKGIRWQNDTREPSVVELSDGRLWVLLRTSLDFFYESFSEDGGTTWSPARPSRFHNTITMPGMLRMEDGRLIVFWCNTVPLPELDHSDYFGLAETIYHTGRAEDVFTNRDAFHAALSSDDGVTWRGFREMLLNERRNDGDFRTVGGNVQSPDRSVHHNQAVELPGGKVLVAVGQNPLMRKLLIFDPAWLEEKTRKDDFTCGLAGWSTHQYVKSHLGMAGWGHCAYNRRHGAQLMPDPESKPGPDGAGWLKEALLIARHPDPRLLHEPEGAVWNFPAGKAGRVSMRIRLPSGSQGARICLCDRWFNPVDPVVGSFAQYAIEIDGGGNLNKISHLQHDRWVNLEVRWSDCSGGSAEFRIDGSADWFKLPLIKKSMNGISYLHIQSIAEGSDPFGILIGDAEASVDA